MRKGRNGGEKNRGGKKIMLKIVATNVVAIRKRRLFIPIRRMLTGVYILENMTLVTPIFGIIFVNQ